MQICPECGDATLSFDGYFQRFICHNRQCSASELSSEKIKEIVHIDAIKGVCKVCGGDVIQYKTVNAKLHCKDCGIQYYKV